MKHDKLVITLFSVCGLLLVASTLIAVLGLPLDSGALILRFDNYRNETTWTGGISVLFAVIGAAVVILLGNLLLVEHIYPKEKFLAYVISAGSLVVSVFFLLAILAITFIN